MRMATRILAASLSLLLPATSALSADLIHCGGNTPDHRDTAFDFKATGPTWRATVYVPGVVGCNQFLLRFTDGGNFTTEGAPIISIPGVPQCDQFAALPPSDPAHHGIGGYTGKADVFCFERANVQGVTQTYRYADLVMWASAPNGAIYALTGADSSTNADLRMTGLGAGPYPRYSNIQIILSVEK